MRLFYSMIRQNQAGFSLLQIMISAGLMVIVMAGTTTMIINMIRHQKTIESRASNMEVKRDLRSLLMVKNNYLLSITSGIPNMTTVTATTSAPITVTVPALPQISMPSVTLADGLYIEPYRLHVNFIRLTNFQPFGVMTGPTRYHFADIALSLSTEKLSSEAASGGEDRFQFAKGVGARLIFESDLSGTVQSCYAVDESINLERLTESFCASMGLGVGPDGTCRIDPKVQEIYHAAGSCPADQLFNGTTPAGTAVCVPKSHVMGSFGSCPAGQYVSGLTSAGTLICTALPEPVAAGGCPGGQMMIGISSAGPICAPAPTFPEPAVAAGACPAGQRVVGLNAAGPICGSGSMAANYTCNPALNPQVWNYQAGWVQSFDATGLPTCGGMEKGTSSCFTAETKIRMADGSELPISEVQMGDWVMSGWNEANQVLGIEVVPLAGRTLYGINGAHPFFTAEHPFATQDGWKSLSPEATYLESYKMIVGWLKTDDYLRTERGWRQLRSLRKSWLPPETRVYNLMLSGDRSYVANGYVVHNKNDY